MSNILILSQNYTFDGLGTLTYTVPATILNGPAVSNVPFSVRCQTTIPEHSATGYGAGSGDGHGAGAGGGDIVGFAAGGSGLGSGATGQGFGPVPNNYTQPLVGVTTPASGPAVSSALSIVVNQNGTPVYTAPALTPTQLSLEFKAILSCTAGDVITVVFSSSAAVDEYLNTIKSNVNIDVGA